MAGTPKIESGQKERGKQRERAEERERIREKKKREVKRGGEPEQKMLLRLIFSDGGFCLL